MKQNTDFKFGVGDVIKSEGDQFYTVIETGKYSGYLFQSDKDGIPIEHSCIISSNMFLGENPKKVANKKLKSQTLVIGDKKYVFYSSGSDDVDTKMASLGVRWEAFYDGASKTLKRKFEDNEDENYHYANSEMVTRWLKSRMKLNKSIS